MKRPDDAAGAPIERGPCLPDLRSPSAARSPAGVPRFDQSRIRLNLDSLGNLTNCQTNVNHRITADLQNDSSLRKSAEPRKRRFQLIRADRQVRQDIEPRFICHDAACQPGRSLCGRYLDAGQYGA